MAEFFPRTQALAAIRAIRENGRQAHSLEDAAGKIVRYLYETLIDPATGNRACALVRLFKTEEFMQMPADLQTRAQALTPEGLLQPRTRCLVLLATVGDVPAWNHRGESRDHQVIPLASAELVARSPMISQLMVQFGIETQALTSPDQDLLLEQGQPVYNVFHIPEAVGSPYIPAQQAFVIPHHIRSVVGFGGPLIRGNLFAAILFLKIGTRRTAAERFKSVALSTELALLPFAGSPVFAGPD